MNRYEVETTTDEKIFEADDWHQDGDFICFYNNGDHGKKQPVRWFNRLAIIGINIIAVVKLPVEMEQPVPIPKLSPPLNGVQYDGDKMPRLRSMEDDTTVISMPAVIP